MAALLAGLDISTNGLKVFYGNDNENPRGWIEQFDLFISARSQAELLILVRDNLRGCAREWFDALEEEETASWRIFVREFLLRYGNEVTELRTPEAKFFNELYLRTTFTEENHLKYIYTLRVLHRDTSISLAVVLDELNTIVPEYLREKLGEVTSWMEIRKFFERHEMQVIRSKSTEQS